MGKLLIYKWGSISEPLFCEVLESLDVDYVEYAREINNYHYDAHFAKGFIDILHREKVEVVFSYDYFPLLAMICEINHLPYLAWIYDCPVRTLHSKTIASEYNYIFCFDRVYTKYLTELGAKNCIHYPLAGDSRMLERARCKNTLDETKFTCDVSFVGNLYNGANNRIRRNDFGEKTHARIEEILKEQVMNYNENIIKKRIQQEREMLEEIYQKCELALGAEYFSDSIRFVADTLGIEATAREREICLAAISKSTPVDLYTSSEIPNRIKKEKVNVKGYVDYIRELPLIYTQSRINLNVTSRNIESGVPQRIFDILVCGGFCMTNYQEEIAEMFEDGKDLVMFRNVEELEYKVKYYLKHESELTKIAECGQRKVLDCYRLEDRIKNMLMLIGNERITKKFPPA